ncbi:uncharacterized protein K452DRAFT_144626 [Aplosporella prunicola CBS 121167]|uniref:Uncharacterized protein n=1 Tax=Aplosporella prunicola CBS 121167 TaxID=1176127 RepID=A0A6A6BKG3_9PEZI|nr:uncharacterized protein K452DRAFT_144626 [Aplosporella prunicola CBS 121167]KAF2144610.1 hypothetical protein K452DRAFT_144626 [Aplosporella prunicola CBS 121167]
MAADLGRERPARWACCFFSPVLFAHREESLRDQTTRDMSFMRTSHANHTNSSTVAKYQQHQPYHTSHTIISYVRRFSCRRSIPPIPSSSTSDPSSSLSTSSPSAGSLVSRMIPRRCFLLLLLLPLYIIRRGKLVGSFFRFVFAASQKRRFCYFCSLRIDLFCLAPFFHVFPVGVCYFFRLTIFLLVFFSRSVSR